MRDRAAALVPIAAGVALLALVYGRVDPGVELVLLVGVVAALVGGHVLLRSRTRRIIAEREAARVRQELDLRAKVAECESRRLRLAAFSRLAAQIAHEVRNPLASIVLNTELLEEEITGSVQATDEMQGFVRAIKSEAERLHGLTDEYLAFARLPEATRSVEPLNPIIAELVQFVASEARQARVAVTLTLSGDDPKVLADARQVRQLALNLVRNSLEAMASGGRLDIATAVEDGLGVLEVRDTGPGIPQEHRELIFEPFFSTKPHGTGLGLALVRRIVQDHGGAIDVRSMPGTSFRVQLPLAQGADARSSSGVASDEAVPVLAGAAS